MLAALLPCRAKGLLPFHDRRRVVGVGTAVLCSFQGLWEDWEAKQLYRLSFHGFHQTGISTTLVVAAPASRKAE